MKKILPILIIGILIISGAGATSIFSTENSNDKNIKMIFLGSQTDLANELPIPENINKTVTTRVKA